MSQKLLSFLFKSIYTLFGVLLLYSLLSSIVQRLMESIVLPGGSVEQVLLGIGLFTTLLVGFVFLYRFSTTGIRNSYVFTKLDTSLKHLDIRIILLLALTLRLGWVLLGEVKPDVDFLGFDQRALDILRKAYWIEPTVPIGASIIFAAHYYFFGHDVTVPLVTIALLSTLQVWLVYDIITRMTGSRGAANLGALLLAIWPEHFLYVNLLGSEVLYSSFLLTSLWLWSKGFDGSGYIRYGLFFLSGIALGISHWIRQTSPVFMLVILFSLITTLFRRWKVRALNSLAFVLGVVFLLTPIVYYNLTNLHVSSIYAAQGFGWSVLVGTNLESQGRYNTDDLNLLNRELHKRTPIPGEHPLVTWNRVGMEIGLQRLASDPFRFGLMTFWNKIPILWGSSAHLGWSFARRGLRWAYPKVEDFATYWHWLMLFLAAASAFALGRSPRLPHGWTVVLIYGLAGLLFAAAHLLVEVQPRYHHLFIPLLVLMIGQGWWLSTTHRHALSFQL